MQNFFSLYGDFYISVQKAGWTLSSDVTLELQNCFFYRWLFDIMRGMIKEISVLILAYLLGSIPSGLWIGKIFFHINLREHGSGNTGTTNTFRILGKKAGIIVFAIDFLKGTLAVLLPTFFGIQGISPMVFGLLAVLGHTFPVLLDSRVEKRWRRVLVSYLVSRLSCYSF